MPSLAGAAHNPSAPISPSLAGSARNPSVPISPSLAGSARNPSVPISPSTDDPTAPGPAPDANGVEAYAAASAEVSERRMPRGEVLASLGLSEASFREAEKRWTAALSEEAKRGERTLLLAHDTAYIAAWQKIRGPFEAADYARLIVATERDTLPAALDAVGVRRTTWMKIKRVFAERIITDPAFAAKVTEARAAARGDGSRRG
ncbi:D-alanyl-D-alanine carboxypeptidase [Minicystis rosea]|nr:D-alanyl-D-alanine carboxypeptidase [Minicystis rosea]